MKIKVVIANLPIYLFENQIEFLLVFEVLGQLYDVRMTLAVMERLDFAEDAGARVPRHLVDDLDGELLVRIHVDASLDAGVGALAQNLTGQLVQVLEARGDERRTGALLLASLAFRLLLAAREFAFARRRIHLVATIGTATATSAVTIPTISCKRNEENVSENFKTDFYKILLQTSSI